MGRTYLVRYGVARVIARLSASEAYPRGQTVVIRTHRGTELGEILVDAPDETDGPVDTQARVLRVATPEDQLRAHRAALEAPRQFDACRAIFDEGTWPIDLIDVEALLDDNRCVLMYLGPYQLDGAGLVAALKSQTGLDVVLEPVGIDAVDPEPEPEPEDVQGGCGEGGCGSGGGCGTGGGCSGCTAKELISTKRRSPIRV